MKLEDKIKALLGEGTVTITGDNLSISPLEDDEDEKDTDVSNDEPTEKNAVEVKEATVSDSSLPASIGKETTAAEDNAKISVGKGRGDKSAGKLTEPTGSSFSNGKAAEDNTKIKAGLSKADKMEKLSVKEHINAMFAGQDLSEEFKQKAEIIFKTAVDHASDEKLEQIKEEFDLRLEEAVETMQEDLVSKIDEYLDTVVEHWVSENEVALESGIRVELVDSFIDGMKSLFSEHYIDVPEDKIDVVEAQAQEIDELQSELETLKESAQTIATKALVLECNSVIAEQSKDLTAIDAEKFKSLCENIEFDTVEDFENKSLTILETYFGIEKEDEIQESKQLTEISKEESDEIKSVVSALSRQLSFSR